MYSYFLVNVQILFSTTTGIFTAYIIVSAMQIQNSVTIHTCESVSGVTRYANVSERTMVMVDSP